MKKNHQKLKILITLAALAIPVFMLATPHFAYADCGLWGAGSSVTDCGFAITAGIAEIAFAAAGAFLTIAGVLLNGTMVATLNIKTIVDATTAIGVAWRTIRDFSSIFIIFLLLYASIKMILGFKDAGLGHLIKNIIIAGLLINFSLFFTKLAVDTSNIISLSFYNAITPGQNVVTPTNGFNGLITSAFNDGGLSNVFMQSLSIQTVASSNAALQPGGDPNKWRTVTLSYAGGTVLMVTAAFSFIFAAVAFAVRIGVLILLMAFSPIYFIGMVFPQTKEYADKWLKTLIAMCLFMPVYLFLMYVAISVINDPHFFDFAKVAATAQTGNNLVTPSTIGIVLQYIIAFLFINAPMAAAIKIGSDGTDIAVKWGQTAKKWSQSQLTRGAKSAGSAAWRETGGRAASKLAENETLKDFASNWKIGAGLHQGIKGAAGSYDEKLKKQVESRTKYGESLGYDQQAMNTSQSYLRGLKQQLAQAQATGQSTTNLKTAIGNAERAISDLENRRKQNYADRINSRSISTVYTKIARKDKVGAAKLQIPIIEEALKHDKDDLKDTKSDIKQIQNAITNNPAGTGTLPIPGVNGLATPAQQATLNGLLAKQNTQITSINNQEAILDQLKLTK